jgi:putative zinc finger protein
MLAINRHVTDRELLQEVDGELSESRRFAVMRHLGECDACRTRRTAIVSAAVEAAVDYRATNITPACAEHSRARLESALAHMAEERDRWRFASTPAIAIAAVAVLVASATLFHHRAADTSMLAARHHLALPVASITPGATWEVSAEELCSGNTHTRPITAAMRAEVLREYGVEHLPSDQYELDYLITPELGGATDTRNLWPQRYQSPTWNARVKDELERLLPQLVCSRQLDLATAQREMAVDWVAAYKKYFKTDLPLEAHRSPAVDDDESTGVYLLADAAPGPAVRLVSFAAVR